jgi:Ca2+ insensitive EF hand protein
MAKKDGFLDTPEDVEESWKRIAKGKPYVTEEDLRDGGLEDDQVAFCVSQVRHDKLSLCPILSPGIVTS